MKKILLLIIVSVFWCCSGPAKIRNRQQPAFKYDIKRPLIGAGFAAISGASWGFHETAVHHSSRMPAGWNRQFWDGEISWRNKYKNGDPAQGANFWGSTTFLAWTTDAKHLFGTAHRVTMFGAGLSLTIGEKRPVWHYLIDTGISFAAFSIGFHSVYTIGFK